jgi:hypothetical protein
MVDIWRPGPGLRVAAAGSGISFAVESTVEIGLMCSGHGWISFARRLNEGAWEHVRIS